MCCPTTCTFGCISLLFWGESAICPAVPFVDVQVISTSVTVNRPSLLQYMAMQRGIIELCYTALDAWQNQTPDYGLCRKLVHVKCRPIRQELHITESWESALIAEVHTPQYHTQLPAEVTTMSLHRSTSEYFLNTHSHQDKMCRSSLVLSQSLLPWLTFQLRPYWPHPAQQTTQQLHENSKMAPSPTVHT